MTNEEQKIIQQKVRNELKDFQNTMIKQPRKEIYNRHYMILGYEAIATELLTNTRNYEFKGFPEQNILEHYYDEFISTSYCADSGEDITLSCKETNEIYYKFILRKEKRKQEQQEM